MTDWNTTIDQHGPDVWRIVYRIVGNEADANDCFQEVFLAAVQSARRSPIRNMGGLLRMVAVQRSIDCLRRRRKDSLTAPGGLDLDQVGGRAENPAGRMQSDEFLAAVRACLAEMPEAEAQAFGLRVFEELSYRQIAQALHIKESYAGVLINRARGRLQERLKTAAVEYGWEFAHEQ